ncbi:MAG: cytidine deaminase [Xanthomonadales bacterium]|nr:cytidine deaminase [Xanthomonadales bacterium]
MKRIDPEILQALLRTRKAAYAPYSGFQVSAVVESADGRTFAGCNVETAHFKSVCAEASALSAMIGAGHRELAAVYVLGPGDKACPPCGDCRQRIHEFSRVGTRVILVDEHGRVLNDRTIEELLPDAFGPDSLDAR